MTTKDEALKLALEALEYIYEGANKQGPHTGISWRCVSNKAEPAITALRGALNAPLAEQPAPATELREQEPVAWGWAIMHSDGTYAWIRPRIADFFGSIQEPEPYTSEDAKHADREWAGLAPHTIVTLYTSPPAQRKPLTDDEYEALVEDLEYWSRYVEVDTAHQSLEAHVRKVLAAHGIKENI